jgi:heme/copper-type cytochrome/quinol oxidase subunit 2
MKKYFLIVIGICVVIVVKPKERPQHHGKTAANNHQVACTIISFVVMLEILIGLVEIVMLKCFSLQVKAQALLNVVQMARPTIGTTAK